jgi:hypothetical protein
MFIVPEPRVGELREEFNVPVSSRNTFHSWRSEHPSRPCYYKHTTTTWLTGQTPSLSTATTS